MATDYGRWQNLLCYQQFLKPSEVIMGDKKSK
jgi:hypothetical protein